MDWRSPISALIPGLEGPVLEALWRSHHPITGGEVARLSRAGSYPGVRLALGRLVRQGLVTARRSGTAISYELNPAHLVYPALAAALDGFDAFGMLKDRLRDLLAQHLPTDQEGFALAILGSVARREATADSDIDLLLVYPDGHENTAEELGDTLRRSVRQWTGNEVQVLTMALGDVKAAATAGDPIVDSWGRDAVTVAGGDVRNLWKTSR
ncbi:MAG: DUF294 nucleotidyltransferase-like domain-containing protein [Cellulomonas sp.]|nr:DUF294 nucleotidyltransferase-like domain-containing protein [Cellulomonas sp.]